MRQSTDTLTTIIKKRPTKNKHASRANAFFEVAGTFVPASQSFGITSIPIKTLQMLVSAYTAIYVDNSVAQRLLHLSQACLAGGLIGLNIAIYLRDDECLLTVVSFCQAAYICESLYKGIMLTGWGASELDGRSKTLDVTSPAESRNGSPESSPREQDYLKGEKPDLVINMPSR